VPFDRHQNPPDFPRGTHQKRSNVFNYWWRGWVSSDLCGVNFDRWHKPTPTVGGYWVILYVLGAIDDLVGAGLEIDSIVAINSRTKPALPHH
jgi:hypothetical protein